MLDATAVDGATVDAVLVLDAAMFDAATVDAALIDAALIDASPDATPPPCKPSLIIATDSTAAGQAMVISEVVIGSYIEVFNNTDTPHDFTANPDLCSPFAYATPSSLAGGGVTAIPPRGYVRFPWPAAFSNADTTAGALLLYQAAALHSQDNILDHICWGNDTSRLTQSQAVDKWITGASVCTGAGPISGALVRLDNVDGTSQADYDFSGTPTLGQNLPLPIAIVACHP